jgi:hypothetical protein
MPSQTLAVQGLDMIACGGKHAAHLMVAPFGNSEQCLALRDLHKLCRCKRLVLAFQHHLARGKQAPFGALQRAGEFGAIGLFDMALGADDTVQQITIIGKQ